MYFSEDKISEIIEKNDIVDLISQYLNLTKKGKNHWGLCPFHTEKTPSFSVSIEKQLFYCFGCGVGGNAITFVQKIERLSYVEALYFLAKRAGISFDERINKNDLEEIKIKEKLYKINMEAAKYFYENIKENSNAMAYLSNRGLEQGVARKFGIGYSLDSWDKLNRFLKLKGYSDELMEKAGLIVKKDRGYYDRFRNRIMFPIMDLKGNIIAFGGRVLDESKPKYLNSPETVIYSKSKNIYALNIVKEIRSLKDIIVVEGYMDVISLYQFGIKNAVASLGTSLTAQQAKLLKRYADEIIIAYDSDAAGQSATLKGLSILQKEGCRVKVLALPEGMDPDDFIREKGVSAFNDLLNRSYSLIEYKILNTKKNYNLNILDDKVRFSKKLAAILCELESPIETDVYIKKYSKEMQINEEAIYAEVKKNKRKHISGNNRHNIISRLKKEGNNLSGQIIAEQKVLNICILYRDKSEYVFKKIKPDDFSKSLHEKIANIINLKIKEGKLISAGELLIHLENEKEKENASQIFNIDISEKDIELLDYYIDRIYQFSIENKIEELIKVMNECYEIKEEEKANKIFMEIMDLQKKKK